MSLLSSRRPYEHTNTTSNGQPSAGAVDGLEWGIYIEFCGDERKLSAGESLTFGRSADLVIDNNPYMHRVIGRFRNRRGIWWIDNRSKHQMIEIRDLSGPSVISVAPGRSVAVLFGEFKCSFTSGPTPYEIIGTLESHEWDSDILGDGGIDGVETVDWARVTLNDDQLDLILALCEQYLLNPSIADAPMITNRQAAVRLGWTISKFNRKLDHLCEKLQRAGVRGLRNEVGGNAMDRRNRLVEHALIAPLVTIADLERLPPI